MKQKNFFIVRYYVNDVCEFAVEITQKQAPQFRKYWENVYENEAGGMTNWFRIDIDSEKKLK